MPFELQLELNRAWIYDENEEESIGERNFVVPMQWLMHNINKICPRACVYTNEDFDDFLNWYCPEEDGQAIYEAAVRMGVLIRETDYYYDEEDVYEE